MSAVRVANAEMRLVMKEAMALGWYVARSSKHIQLKHPDGFHFTVCGTPKNATACRKKALRDLHKFPYTT
jgi:predicted RNA binding protein YcfA (HicA-like mRNA interferase family)